MKRLSKRTLKMHFLFVRAVKGTAEWAHYSSFLWILNASLWVKIIWWSSAPSRSVLMLDCPQQCTYIFLRSTAQNIDSVKMYGVEQRWVVPQNYWIVAFLSVYWMTLDSGDRVRFEILDLRFSLCAWFLINFL